MDFKEAIIYLFDKNNTSQLKMSKSMGYKNASGLSEQLRNNNMSISILLELLKNLDKDNGGYELVLRPKGGSNISDRTVVIDKAKPMKKRNME